MYMERNEIIVIDNTSFNQLLDDMENDREYEPRDYVFKDGEHYITVDNTGGECWTEQFRSLGIAIGHLKGTIDVFEDIDYYSELK